MNGKLKILTSMAIFGTVGIFVRFIPMASTGIAWCRGVMGCIFLLILMAITGKKPNLGDIKRNGWILAISGAAIGGNRFGNREGLLPDAPGRTWTECDINTNGASGRGAERIVFSNDGLIYYTSDHYESFEVLYE